MAIAQDTFFIPDDIAAGLYQPLHQIKHVLLSKH
mgnify:CR=1 FL=1